MQQFKAELVIWADSGPSLRQRTDLGVRKEADIQTAGFSGTMLRHRQSAQSPKLPMALLASKSSLSNSAQMKSSTNTIVPNISEKYSQSLLGQADALDAVSIVSGFWSHRADESKAMFGLSLPEYQCQLILIYTGEVGNGGHVQYFDNRGRDYVEDLLVALEALPLHVLARILRQALKIQDDIEGLKVLDQRAWEHISAVDSVLQAFLCENSQIVLKPERS